MPTDSKPWWKSKTLWLAILQLVSAIIGEQTGTMDMQTALALGGSGGAMAALRLITNTGIKGVS